MSAKKTRLMVSGVDEVTPQPRSTRRMLPGDAAGVDGHTLVLEQQDDIALSSRRTGGAMGRCPACDTEYTGLERFCPFDGASIEPVTHWDRTDDPLIGATISDRYVVEDVLAEGGMGTVYRVRHCKLESLFALKLLHSDLAEDPEVAERLIAEARATAAIGHPNIVGVADFGEIDGSVLPELGDAKLPYFVMEYLSGPSLAKVLREEVKLPAERVANIMVQIAGALAAAHKEGIIHRDLKPENIRLSHDEIGGEIAKVLDFGVAKVMGSSKKTQAGMVFGTPHYMSPEQGQGKEIDHRSDIYSLGVLMYECLTGTVPFVADTFMGVITKHMFEAPAPIDLEGLVDLEPIMMRCLAKTPNGRYETMSEVVQDLERAIGGEPTVADMDRPPKRSGADRHTRGAMAMGDGVLGAGASEIAHPARRWLWAAVTVIAASTVAFAVVQLASGEGGDAETVPESPANERPAQESQPPTAPAAQPDGTAASPATSASAAPDTLPNGQPSDQHSAKPSVAPHRPPPSVVHPVPVRPHPKGGDVVDPWAK